MRYILTGSLLATVAWSQSPAENPQLASAKAYYVMVRSNVLKSADKMPEDKWGFRPVDEVKSYGQMLAHIADAQFYVCGVAKLGDSSKTGNRSVEKTATTKAEIVKWLNEGFAYCDSLYSELTDTSSAAMVNFFGQQRTKLSVLAFNTAHVYEHYGNLVTYMRMNKIVPPTSEPPPAAPPAVK
ncbi:MAG TPA: DinB family protein [Bryobacteraceae bacterium]|nr:DinB family protein [Bryobacteraceae bacterium]